MSKRGAALTWTGCVSGSSLQSDLYLKTKTKNQEKNPQTCGWTHGSWTHRSLFPWLTSGGCISVHSGRPVSQQDELQQVCRWEWKVEGESLDLFFHQDFCPALLFQVVFFLCFLGRLITRFIFPLFTVKVAVGSVLPARWAAAWLGCLEAFLTVSAEEAEVTRSNPFPFCSPECLEDACQRHVFME